jgi:glycosyltransferase involved in cell wall biosynthesis
MFHGNVTARLLRLVLPFPVVIDTVHSLAESSRKSARIWHRDLVYRLTQPLTDMTVAVSQAVAARHMAAGCVRQGAVRVIPNGIDTTLYHPGDPRATDHFTWLAAGRLIWKKDYPTLLRAFAAVGRGRLRIAGTGPDEPELRRIAPARVEFLGERSDMPELMQSADAFVLSSIVEGLPVALLEAAASGIPAVATDAGGVRETVPALLVPPGNPEALAEAMNRLMSLPADERRALGRAARERALAEWDWKVITEHWVRLYEELAATGRTGWM